MHRVLTWSIRAIPRGERGQELVEYGMLLALVAVVVVAVVALLGDGFSTLLGEIASEVGP